MFVVLLMYEQQLRKYLQCSNVSLFRFVQVQLIKCCHSACYSVDDKYDQQLMLLECRGKDDGQVLKKKVLEKLESVSRTRQDSIHNLLKDLAPKSTVWVKNSCYKKYTHKQKRFGKEQVATK